MLNTQSVNDAFTPIFERPASHAAAGVFLGTSIYVAHEGLMRWAPGNLGGALTALFVATAALQWLSGSRKMECEDAKDGERADAVTEQAWRFGIIEGGLFAMGGLALSNLAIDFWSVAAAIVCGALFSYSSYRVKWTMCDPVQAKRSAPSNGGTRVHDPLLDGPALPADDFQPAAVARYTSDEGVVDFEKALRKRGEVNFNEVDPRLSASAVRDAGERYKLWVKRERMRQTRAAEKQAVAA